MAAGKNKTRWFLVSDFISDKEMVKLEKNSSPDFISDKEMVKISKDKSYDWSKLPRDLARSTIDALPTYGQAAGSFLSGGNPAISGLGQAAGASLKRGINQVIDEPLEKTFSDLAKMPTKKNWLDLATQSANDFNEGAVSEIGGKALGKTADVLSKTKVGQNLISSADEAIGVLNSGLQKTAQAISPSLKKKNSQEIINSAEKLGLKLTPAMLDDSGFVERFENELSKSPSYMGQSINRQQKEVVEKLRGHISDLTKDASISSPFELGEAVKSGMSAKVAERLDPSVAAFQEVAKSTAHIPVNKKSIAAIAKNVENIPEFYVSGGKGKPREFLMMLENAKNANDIKTIKTMMNNAINSNATDSTEKSVLIAMKDKFSNLEKNSIMRSAIEIARESGSGKGSMPVATGEKIGSEIVDLLGAARKEYGTVAKDLQSIGSDAGLKIKGPSTFLNEVEKITSENVPSKFFNVGNNRLMSKLQIQFPNEFELLRQGKLQQILNSATDNTVNGQGNLSAQRFLNTLNKINPEAKKMIFGEAGVKTIGDIKTIQQSLPRNFNTSNTASSANWMDALQANLKDIPAYAIYKGASSNLANNVRTNLLKVPQLLELSKVNPETFRKIVETTSARVLSEKVGEPLKGFNKWADNGINKVLAFVGTGGEQYQTVLNEIAKTKKGSDLLIKASDSSKESLPKIIEELKKTDEYKNFENKRKDENLKRSLPQEIFPLKLKKNGSTAMVNNIDELNEAKSEGWIK